MPFSHVWNMPMLMSCNPTKREMGHTNPDAWRISQILEPRLFRRYVVVDLRPERGAPCYTVLSHARADIPISASKPSLRMRLTS
jgi:hypothetical protein